MSLIVEATATPTITSGSAYASGNALGGLLTFSAKGLGDQAIVRSVAIVDKAGQKAAMDLLLFSQTFTATADKSAISISAADALNCEGTISIATGDYVQMGTPAVATKIITGLLLNSADGDNKIYGQLVCRGTPTYTSTSDIVVTLDLEIVKESFA